MIETISHEELICTQFPLDSPTHAGGARQITQKLFEIGKFKNIEHLLVDYDYLINRLTENKHNIIYWKFGNHHTYIGHEPAAIFPYYRITTTDDCFQISLVKEQYKVTQEGQFYIDSRDKGEDAAEKILRNIYIVENVCNQVPFKTLVSDFKIVTNWFSADPKEPLYFCFRKYHLITKKQDEILNLKHPFYKLQFLDGRFEVHKYTVAE